MPTKQCSPAFQDQMLPVLRVLVFMVHKLLGKLQMHSAFVLFLDRIQQGKHRMSSNTFYQRCGEGSGVTED